MFELYKSFPDSFITHGERFPVPRLYKLNSLGQLDGVYTIVGDPDMLPFHAHIITEPGYQTERRDAQRQ